ncbi:Benzoyl-CoA oxygenase component B, partial [Frankliniella fusca]
GFTVTYGEVHCKVCGVRVAFHISYEVQKLFRKYVEFCQIFGSKILFTLKHDFFHRYIFIFIQFHVRCTKDNISS